MAPPRPPIPAGAVIAVLMRATGNAHAAPLLAKLGIPDLLADRPRTAAELAEATETRPDALRRFLAFCVCLDLVSERAGGVFQLTELGSMLVTSDAGFRDAAALRGERAYVDRWVDLEAVVRGQKPSQAVEGVDLMALRRARVAVAHRAALAGCAAAFARSETYVDVGSGDPALVAGILAASGRSEAIFIGSAPDLARAKAHLSAARVAHRCELVAPAAELPAGDALVLSHRIEELGDDHAATLLGRCRSAVRRNGRVLIIGSLSHDPYGRMLGDAAAVDLEMLLFTPSGTLRSEEALRALCTRSGLTPKRFVPTESAYVLEATPEAMP